VRRGRAAPRQAVHRVAAGAVTASQGGADVEMLAAPGHPRAPRAARRRREREGAHQPRHEHELRIVELAEAHVGALFDVVRADADGQLPRLRDGAGRPRGGAAARAAGGRCRSRGGVGRCAAGRRGRVRVPARIAGRVGDAVDERGENGVEDRQLVAGGDEGASAARYTSSRAEAPGRSCRRPTWTVGVRSSRVGVPSMANPTRGREHPTMRAPMPPAVANRKVGTGTAWRVGDEMLGATVPMRFHAGEPFRAGLGWQTMESRVQGHVGAVGRPSRSSPRCRAASSRCRRRSGA
jgi:hypothetical protein